MFPSARQAYSDIQQVPEIVGDVMKDLSKVKAQVFVVHGKEDRSASAQSVSALKDLNPVVYIRPGKGHSLVEEDSNFLGNLLDGLAYQQARNQRDRALEDSRPKKTGATY